MCGIPEAVIKRPGEHVELGEEELLEIWGTSLRLQSKHLL